MAKEKEQGTPPKRVRGKPQYRPWHPEEYEAKHIEAVQALIRGDAEPHQQQLIIGWVITNLCRTYDADYIPDSERDSAFAAGKRHVGLQLVKMANLLVSKFTKSKQAGEQG